LQTIPAEPAHRGRDFIAEVQPRRRLEELVLPDLVHAACAQLIEEQLRADLLRSHGLEPRHRVLLVGPPGNGKTTLAEAVAEALALPLFVVRYELMIGSYLGETAARLKRLFDYVRTTPCVLFFDEFDVLGKERGDTHETGEIKRVVSSLLLQIDDLPSYAIVMAATNHAELLDRAVWRRFQIRLELPKPTQKQMSAFIATFLSRHNEPAGMSADTLAKRLGPVSYSEAEQFCLDLLRRQVLAMGERPLKAIVVEQLKLWSARVSAAPTQEDKPSRAGTSAPQNSGT
jgi:SpoVK/Ycf46/Vps4 family AAA+-type ATPase